MEIATAFEEVLEEIHEACTWDENDRPQGVAIMRKRGGNRSVATAVASLILRNSGKDSGCSLHHSIDHAQSVRPLADFRAEAPNERMRPYHGISGKQLVTLWCPLASGLGAVYSVSGSPSPLSTGDLLEYSNLYGMGATAGVRDAGHVDT